MTRDKIESLSEWGMRREIWLTWTGITLTVAAAIMLIAHMARVSGLATEAENYGTVAEIVLFAVVMALLVYGNLLYQFCRLGYFKRLSDHEETPRDELEKIYETPAAPLCVLVPSYKEESHIVRQTLMSAALMEYPNRRIALLIDDPPIPSGPDDMAALNEMRALAGDVEKRLALAARPFRLAQKNFEQVAEQGQISVKDEFQILAGLYEIAADRLGREAEWHQEYRSGVEPDHTDQFFVERILLEPARAHHRRAADLRSRAPDGSSDGSDLIRIRREYQRLASLFSVSITCFERKQFQNLSHAPNKAMNLNSYIGLLGGDFRSVTKQDGDYLQGCPADRAEFHVPQADYLITLDADSLLLSDYALRLIAKMEEKGGERLAVIQTPYSAIPGSTRRVEQVAGATTDIQYIVHQGFTHFDATYWVGANALLRRSALDEICVEVVERNHLVKLYIQDQTVIEDTESSVDLIERDWKLHNYPDRLAFSATPPDFGALLIQRRRWANGGLIIFPKLVRYLTRGPLSIRKCKEAFMRVHYLISLAAVSVGVLTLLYYPFDESVATIWLPLTAISYFVFYARDLTLTGYRWTDMFRVYALNLILIPVILEGVFKSIQQMWTGRKTPFGRTPKISDRTSVPAMCMASQLLIVGGCVWTFSVDAADGRLWHALFSLINGGLFAYAIWQFIGVREALRDLCAGLPFGMGELAFSRSLAMFRPDPEHKPADRRSNIGTYGQNVAAYLARFLGRTESVGRAETDDAVCIRNTTDRHLKFEGASSSEERARVGGGTGRQVSPRKKNR